MKKASGLFIFALVTLLSFNGAVASIDTGLGQGHGGAVINSTEGGFVNTTTVNGVANLNFQGDTHVTWDSLNINSNETLNFNAVNNSSGFTVLNTVNNNMSQIYGRINIDPNIGQVIISNPNGVLFDGTKFDVVAANNFVVTTAQMNATFNNFGKMNVSQQPFTAQSGDVVFQHLKYNEFFIDGDFTIIAPRIFFDGSNGFKFVTTDGQNFVYKLEEDNSHIPINIGASLDGYLQEITGNGSNSENNNQNTNDNNQNPNNNTEVNSQDNNSTEPIVVNTEVEPWEEGGTIEVSDEEVSGNNTVSETQTNTNTEVNNQDNNSTEPIVVNAELEPWEDGGTIEVDIDGDNTNNNTNSGTNIASETQTNTNPEVNNQGNNSNEPIVINAEIKPWEDGGTIEVDMETYGIVRKSSAKSDSHEAATLNKNFQNNETKSAYKDSMPENLTPKNDENIVINTEEGDLVRGVMSSSSDGGIIIYNTVNGNNNSKKQRM